MALTKSEKQTWVFRAGYLTMHARNLDSRALQLTLEASRLRELAEFAQRMAESD